MLSTPPHHISYHLFLSCLYKRADCAPLPDSPPTRCITNYAAASCLIAGHLCLLLSGRRLEVLVSGESESATDQDDGVEADAHVGLLGAAGGGGGGLLGFGGRVVGLDGESGVSYEVVLS